MSSIVIEEMGTIVESGAGFVVVEVLKTSACQSCKAKQGCGQAVLSQMGSEAKQSAKNQFRIPYPEPIARGSQVLLEMSAEIVSKVALLIYILPLLIGFIGMWLASQLQWSEGWQLLVFLTFLIGAYVVLGRLSTWRSQTLIPRIKRVVLQAPDLINTQPIQSR